MIRDTHHASPHMYSIAGLMRCCIETIHDRAKGDLPTDNEVIDCKYCSESIIYKEDHWTWNNTEEHTT